MAFHNRSQMDFSIRAKDRVVIFIVLFTCAAPDSYVSATDSIRIDIQNGADQTRNGFSANLQQAPMSRRYPLRRGAEVYHDAFGTP